MTRHNYTCFYCARIKWREIRILQSVVGDSTDYEAGGFQGERTGHSSFSLWLYCLQSEIQDQVIS